jgi:hypothetical protein
MNSGYVVLQVLTVGILVYIILKLRDIEETLKDSDTHSEGGGGSGNESGNFFDFARHLPPGIFKPIILPDDVQDNPKRHISTLDVEEDDEQYEQERPTFEGNLEGNMEGNTEGNMEGNTEGNSEGNLEEIDPE